MESGIDISVCLLALADIEIPDFMEGRYLFAKNYMLDRSLYQPAYRDGYATFILLRKSHGEAELTPLQASYHEASQRKGEELYHVKDDPKYDSVLKKQRKELKEDN